MLNNELIREAKRINSEVALMEKEEEKKENRAGSYYTAPRLTLATPIAILSPNDIKEGQLKNAIKKIAHGVDKEEIELVIDMNADTSVLGYFDINSCKQGIVITHDKFYCTWMEKGESLISNKKVAMPLMIENIAQLNVIPQQNSYLKISMKDGTIYEAYVSIYGEFTYRLLDYLMNA